MKKNGFSLIELLVVISIIVIFTLVSIPNLKRGEEAFALQRAAHKLAQDLSMVSTMATTGKQPFPRGGYGIYFGDINTNEYLIFRDENGDKFYNGIEERIASFSLEEKNVFIEMIFPSFPLAVVFFPPDPTVTIKTLTGTFSSAEIFLRQRNKGVGVRINTAGLVEIFEP